MIFIKLKFLPLGTEGVRKRASLFIRLPAGDHTSRDTSLRLGVRIPVASTALPTSQHLHHCCKKTEASPHPLLPTIKYWRLSGRV